MVESAKQAVNLLQPTLRAFLPLVPSVERSRLLYLRQLERLPLEARKLAVGHHKQRIATATDHVLLGELVPWMIAESLGCLKKEWMSELCGNWLLLYFGVLLLDDALDAPGTLNQQEALVVASLLQQRGVCGLLTGATDPRGLRHEIDRRFADSAEAACHELRRQATNSRHTDRELSLMGKKLAVVRVCAAAIADAANCPAARVSVPLAIFDDFLVASQLLDDLTDWEEDHLAGRATMPLTLLSARDAEFHRSALQRDHGEAIGLLVNLIRTGALEDTLKKALDLIRHCNLHLKQFPAWEGVCWKDYCQRLDAVGTVVLGELHRARTNLLLLLPRSSTSRTLSENEQRVLRRTTGRVRRQLQIVAQSS